MSFFLVSHFHTCFLLTYTHMHTEFKMILVALSFHVYVPLVHRDVSPFLVHESNLQFVNGL